jgi:hypothetical protein
MHAPRGKDLVANADQAIDKLETGDVLLYQQKDFGSFVNSLALRTPWTHVGMVIRDVDGALTSLVQEDYARGSVSSPVRESLLVLEAVPGRGVSLFPLEARLARTVNHVRFLALRTLSHSAFSNSAWQQRQQSLNAFVKQVIGRKLEVAPSFDILRAACMQCCGVQKAADHEDWTTFFCTELVAEGLQQLGVLREAGVNSNDFLPSGFSQHEPTAGGNISLDDCTASGYTYAPERLLLYPNAPLADMLRARKRVLFAESRGAGSAHVAPL